MPRVTLFYLGAGWVAFEVADATFPRLGIPDWAVTFVLILLLLGFPLAVGLAWVFDFTPEGVRRTPAASATGEREATSEDASARRDLTRAALVGAAAVLAIAAGVFLLFGNRESGIEMAPDAIVVLPFTVRGGADVEVLAEGMVEALSTKLDGVGALRSVDPNTVLSHTETALEPAEARDLARRLGAGHYVLGSVLEFGGDLRIQASIYATEGDGEPVEESVEGPEDSLLELVDDLTAKLLLAGGLAPPGRLPRIAAMTTEDLAAQKLFWEGEHEFRAARYDNALERFERAVEVDSTFALAYYRMAVAASWAERPALSRNAVDAAQRHEDRLGQRDRSLIAAFRARRFGRNAEAERLYRAYLASYPDDAEAWYELGEVLAHWGAFSGVPLSEASEPFERTVALDPNHVSALFHLANMAALNRDRPAVDSLTREVRAGIGGDNSLSLDVQWAFAIGDSTARARQLERIADATSPLAAQTALVNGAWATTDLESLRDILDAASDVPVTPFDWILGSMLATFGVRGEALDWMERRESTELRPPLRTAVLAAQPFLRTPGARLEQLRTRILEWDPGPVRTDPVTPEDLGSLEPVLPQVRAYTLGLIDVRLGRNADALHQADALDAFGGTPEARMLAGDLARHIRAAIQLVQGNAAEALNIIESASIWETSMWDNRASLIYSHAGPVLLRADALEQLGRHEEATRWYRTFSLGPQLFAYAKYREGLAWEALGQTDRAAACYAAFLDRWARADADLQDYLADARRRLAVLVERD